MCINMSKVCTGCGKTKTHCEFGKRKKSKDGLNSKCKECKKIDNQKFREQNPNYNKIYYQDNTNYFRQYYDNNKDDFKQYQSTNKTNISIYLKNYYKTNREMLLENMKEYNKINRVKINQQQKERLQDPLENLKHIIRNYISRAIKNINIEKTKLSFEVVGLESWDKLREHIESQWMEGMNWDNHGVGKDNTTWHIDHIIPISSATTEDEVYKLNHYTNLRPMWCTDNIKKRNKILPL